MKNKLRLIFTKECGRKCPGCCNNDWGIDKLPSPEHFNYDEIIITGGDPLNKHEELIGFVKALRIITDAKIIVYTANGTYNPAAFFDVLKYVDGITLTLHNNTDYQKFNFIMVISSFTPYIGKTMRLNVFKEVDKYDRKYVEKMTKGLWSIKDNIEWIENCPLPEGEVLMKL